jgi:choice-of-anchor A domain-containing protein
MLPLAPAQAVIGVAANALKAINGVNLITLGNYSSSADVEGKMYIGGDLSGSGSLAIGNSANGQFATDSTFRTLTVMGNITANINLNNGTGASNAGTYGLYLGHNLNNTVTFNDVNAKMDVAGDSNVYVQAKNGMDVKVAGNFNAAVDVNAGAKVAIGGRVTGFAQLSDGAGTSFSVVGDAAGGMSVGANATAKVGGSVLYGNNTVNVGGNAVVTVSGSVSGGVSTSSGSDLTVGGLVGSSNFSGGSIVHMGSYANGQNDKLAVSAGSSVYVGSTVGKVEMGGGLLEVRGDINQMLNYSGGVTVKASGSIYGSGNGIQSTTKIYAGGSIADVTNTLNNCGGNCPIIRQNYDWSETSQPSMLTAPPAPAAPALVTVTAVDQMMADMAALSDAMAALNSNFKSKVTYGAGVATIRAVSSQGANPFAVLTVNESIFTSTELNYIIANSTLPLIVNVVNSDAATHANKTAIYDWNLTPIGNATNAHNQQIIWNFTDAAVLTLHTQVENSILAPYATVHNVTDINGSLVAKIFNQGGEVHLGTFQGLTPILTNISPPNPFAAAPEPGTWATMLVGFGAIGRSIRRRRGQKREFGLAA